VSSYLLCAANDVFPLNFSPEENGTFRVPYPYVVMKFNFADVRILEVDAALFLVCGLAPLLYTP
jgi:hypothetical protein